ncbi:uncharacterized protein LOC131662856 [Phymastichus coffea]|uniref:uncharacterized protein LOC131662856 n=1 Tax=Phymastichus coffea TaxID=108790 RepID=UPI00273B8DDF|nr:uncharacterized protein LOC131662856 [Phymastichus coffea]
MESQEEDGDSNENQEPANAAYLAINKSHSQEQQSVTCWLYVSPTNNGLEQASAAAAAAPAVVDHGLPRASLEEAIRAVDPLADWHVSETRCGLIAGFAREADADKLLQRGDLARIFQCPVQVARFCERDTRYRQAVLLRDVPWAIPLQDLNSALGRQGIETGSIERLRHYVRVEVLEPNQYEQLLRQGLDFFGAARFTAIPERWWRNNGSSGPILQNPFASNGNQVVEGNSSQQQQQNDDVLQCYRCQGFWHVAANCRHLPRCVRCGEPHSVEFCSRPRNNPICCHCSGPHHAGYRQCPVRLQLVNATQVSLTVSANRLNSNASSGQTLFNYNKPSSNAASTFPTQKPS